ncbi:MAG: hypothetical protein K0U66_08915, partial [Gammaproteobacteria bacterium]|nr:hypothetical protein [Gammaproteobacteria bacterium]
MIPHCDGYPTNPSWRLRDSYDTPPFTVRDPITSPTFNSFPREVVANQDYTITWSNPSNAQKVYLHESGSNGHKMDYPFLSASNLPTSMTFNKKDQGVAYTYQLSACSRLECGPQSSAAVVKVRTNQRPKIQWAHEPLTGPVHPDDDTTLRVIVSDDDETLNAGNIQFFTDACHSGRCDLGFPTAPISDNCEGCYHINWKPYNKQSSGQWTVRVSAEVTDSAGANSTISTSVTVDHNRPPKVLLESPPISLKQYDRVHLLATAEDKDGEIASVQFWINGSPLGEAIEAPPYSLEWAPQASGTVRLEARATDNEGSTHTSTPHTLQVVAAEKPPVPSGLAILTVDEQPQPNPNYTGAYRITWNTMPSTTYYKLEQKQDGVDADFQQLPLANQEFPGHYLPNQSAGRYHYRVSACNPSKGCSAPSAEVAITVVGALAAPQGLAARPDPDLDPADEAPQFTGSYTLSWNRVGDDGALEYYLQERFGGPETPTSEAGPWQTRYRGTAPQFVIEDKSPGQYSYQVLACLKDNPERCSAQNEQIAVSVVTPVLTAAKLACDGSCIDFVALGLDPDASLTLTAVAEPGITQTLAADDDRLVRTSGNSFQVTIQAEGPLYQQLFVLGVEAMAINPNGAQGGITAYGDHTTEIIGQTSASPAIGPNGIMYVATGNQLHALKADTGEDIQQPGWPFTAGGTMRATPRVDSVDGTIYVGAMDQNLYAITPYAIEKWRLPTRGNVISPVVLDQTRSLYFGTFIEQTAASKAEAACGDGGVLYAVNAQSNAEDETARIKWTFPTECGIAKEPVLAGDNTLYFSTANSSQIYAITRDNRGPGKLDWESIDDPDLWGEIGNWQPAPTQETDFLGIARLYRGLLQPPLPFSRKILTFWTHQLTQGNITHVGVAKAFLESTTGRVNVPESLSNEAFVEALYQRIFPAQGQPRITWGGLSYGPAELILQLEGGFSRAQIAVLMTQSQEYTDATSALLSRSFHYLYDPDYSWGGGTCTDEDPFNCDSDKDGLPDWWEMLYFGNLDQDGSDDPDGDGRTNEDAYLGDDDPCENGCYNGVKETPPEPSAPLPLNQTDLEVSAQTGTLPGEFRVNEAGAATYSIPLSLPAGTAGVAPQLALNYSSRAGNGLLGQGWQLSGLSGIARCRQTPGQDNHSAPITWGAEDRFCLDGQRLVLDSGNSYGAPGSQYRSEIDSYALITAHGGSTGNPAYFTVERKDGSISYYGRDQQGNQSQHTFVGLGTLSWRISRSEDSVGNPIDFFYEREGGHRIREIRYAYGDSGNPAASVAFEYAVREDVIRGYVAGAELITDQRLQTIRVRGMGDKALRDYEIGYMRKTDYRGVLSRIERLRECAGDICQPWTTFDWRLPPILSGMERTAQLTLDTPEQADIDPRPADINGDGRLDIAWMEFHWDDEGNIDDQWIKYVLAEEHGFGAVQRLSLYISPRDSVRPYRWEILDYNADGRADLAVYDQRVGAWQLHQSKYIDGGWKLSSPKKLSLNEKDIRFIDINGDGLADAVSHTGYWLLEPKEENGPAVSDQFYHFGAKQSLEIVGAEPWVGTPASTTTHRYLSPDVVGDFDSDGQVDLVLMDTQQNWRWVDGESILKSQHTRAYIAKVQGNQLILNKLLDFVQLAEDFKERNHKFDVTPLERHQDLIEKLQSVDINNDGLVDLVKRKKRPSSYLADAYYLANNGEGLNAPVLFGAFSKDEILHWFDYEGDGDTDLIWSEPTGLQVRRWQSHLQSFSEAEKFQSIGFGQHIFVDVNGDGSTDWLRFSNDRRPDNNDHYLQVYQSRDPKIATNVIETITNGLGAQTNMTFGSSITSGHYARLGVDAALDRHCSSAANKSGYSENDEVAAWCIQYKASLDTFYEALNGDWQGNHTLGKTSPLLEMAGAQFLVTRVESSAPATDSETAGAVDPEATSAISYFYGRARLQAGGRGLLGFERVRTVDEQSGVRTTTQYRQDFPFLGYPQRTETHSPAGNLLSEADNIWALHGWKNDFPQRAKAQGTVALGALKPYLATSVEKTYDFINDGQNQGRLLKTVTTTTEQDAHGNVIQLDTTTEADGGSFSTKTANDYGSGQSVNFQNTEHNFNSYAQLGRLLKTTVIHERSEAGIAHSAIRHSAFSYYDSGDQAGLLKQEILEPDDPLRLVTRYEYDRFGNKILAEQSAADAEPRTRRWTYNPSGRFVDAEINGYGQTISQVNQRNAAGQPTEIIDTAGV